MSSSVIVIVAGEPTGFPSWLAVTMTVSAASTTSSCRAVTVAVTEPCPIGSVSVFDEIV